MADDIIPTGFQVDIDKKPTPPEVQQPEELLQQQPQPQQGQ